jgi:hypothetical protein
MKELNQFLQEINACRPAIQWAGERTIEDVVKDCHRGDWLLWLAKKINLDKRTLTLAKGKCAETVIDLMKDDRSKAAVKAAIDYGNGLISDDLLQHAADAAYAAAYAAADAATDAAAAADAAYAAYAAAAADAYAADAAAYAAAAADAFSKNQKLTADICREIIGDQIIQLINSKLSQK